MNNFALLFGLVYFPLAGIQLFVSRSLLKQPTAKSRLFVFSCLQAATHLLLETIVPFFGLKVVLQTTTHMIFHIAVFEAAVIPTALFAAIFPVVLGIAGELSCLPLYTRFFGLSWKAPFPPATFSPRFTWITSFPSLLLALFFLIRPTQIKARVNLLRRDPKKQALKIYLSAAAATAIHTFCILDYVYRGPEALRLSPVYVFAGVVILPALGGTLFQYAHDSRRAQKAIEYHARRRKLQERTLRALREERHDILNELTLISSYVEMQKWDQAQKCIAYTAASLSDRYNYATLPEDAWLTILAAKQKEAAQRKIDFTTYLEAPPPRSYAEQRLLPKIIANLVDNAFTAVEDLPNPQVRLFWREHPPNQRLLAVTDNGPPISPDIKKRIFQEGVSTKTNNSENSGWGLVICKRVAETLGATLTCQSDEHETTFNLVLPGENWRPQSKIGTSSPLPL